MHDQNSKKENISNSNLNWTEQEYVSTEDKDETSDDTNEDPSDDETETKDDKLTEDEDDAAKDQTDVNGPTTPGLVEPTQES